MKLDKHRSLQERFWACAYRLAAVLLLLPSLALGREFLPDPEIEAGASSYSHHYGNCRYGFSLEIPKGQTGYDETGELELTGVGIILARGKVRAYLEAYATANPVGFTSQDEAAAAFSKLMCKQRGGVIMSEAHSDVKLDGQTARRVVMECRSPEGRQVIDDSTTLFHARRQMVYTIGLRVDRSAYGQYVPRLEAVLQSWRLTEPGCGEKKE